LVIKTRLESELKQIELDIDASYRGLDAQESQERAAPGELGSEPAPPEKIQRLTERQARRQTRNNELQERGATQRSRTDSGARALHKRGQQTFGYNVRTVVDHKHRLIAHHEVVDAGPGDAST
jgi:hypothetical protein